MHKKNKYVHTYSRGEKMKRRLKKSVVYAASTIAFIALVATVTYLGTSARKQSNTTPTLETGIFDNNVETKIVHNEPVLIRPYLESDVKVVKQFYDYEADEKSQENSLILYKDTYMQSTGVAYSNGKQFDVIAVLDGKVTQVKEDDTLGNTIMIEHKNGTTSVYQSVSDIAVKEGDTVSQGQVIAKSSTSDVRSDLENHLYFELIIDGNCVNPENYYDKTIES